MSEVKFYCLEQRWGGDCSWYNLEKCDREYAEYVGIATYDATQSELAALQEELEREKSRYAREVLGLNNEGDPIGGDPAGGYKNDNVQLQQRLTAAEQRNAELWKLVEFAYDNEEIDAPWVEDYLRLKLLDAALKPTESGASE